MIEEDQKVLSYTIEKKFQETDMDAYEALMAQEYRKEAEEKKEFYRQNKKKLSKKQVKYYVQSNSKFSGFRVSNHIGVKSYVWFDSSQLKTD